MVMLSEIIATNNRNTLAPIPPHYRPIEEPNSHHTTSAAWSTLYPPATSKAILKRTFDTAATTTTGINRNDSPVASEFSNISPDLAASSSYSAKMTICGQGSRTSRENCANNLSPYRSSSSSVEAITNAHQHQPTFSLDGRGHSSPESPSSLAAAAATAAAAGQHNSPPERVCIHNNLSSKCENCNAHRSPPLRTAADYGSNKLIMNSINPEALLAHETKHLFGSNSGGVAVGIGPNPLTGHLGPIGTSIASMVSSGVNPGISVAGSHLHHSHHHPHPHQTTLHSMTTPGFSIHGHLVSSGSQRRMSNTSGGGPPNRTSKAHANNKQQQFLCPMCNKFFTQKGNLKTHMMIHTGDKPYVCHVCGKSFTQKGNVDTHIKIHTGTKEYSCDRCGRSFTQKGNLKTHMRSVHTKEKPYACSVCGKSFSQKGNMRTHIRTHNKEDRFPCGLCGKTFSQKGNLKTHMQRHAGTLPKRYGPGGQRRQTTSRLLQVSSIGGAQSAAAAAAAAAYAIAAAGNVGSIDRGHPNPQTSQPNTQINRNTPLSPNGADDSRSQSSMAHVTTASINGANQRSLTQQSVISNVQNLQASRDHPLDSPSLYPGSSDAHNLYTQSHHAISHHLQQPTNSPNSFNLTTAPSAAAAAAAVLLSSSSSFSKDHKTNHLHFMSSLFH